MAKEKKNKKSTEIVNETLYEVVDSDEGIIVEKNQLDISKKKLKRQKRNRVLFILWNVISIIFYSVSSILSLKKEFKSDTFSYIIIGAVIIYALVFIGITIASSSSKAAVKANRATFKTQIKMWRVILGLFNLVLSINIFINTLLAEKNGLVITILVFAVIFTLIRLLISFISIILLVFKQKRINKKKRKIKEKQRLKKLEQTMIKK